ncbi:cystathionine beta-lyase [Rhizobium rhizosphaerae]|uniref:Cystathionine beta-lyase n=1 Tax=Xaviernesmea rhizosphaerae TaxID=1672749 RepID=A0A1Q9AJQ7_9HYPH|nr:cystathionine beta-lyase [Xaviernesmea rhizosphaerae]OLP55488.1 cystathionine beta-lyase [Xaviernesmea rhizosphaerae]
MTDDKDPVYKDALASAGMNTRLAHLGNHPFDFHGFVNPPVVHASTVLFPNAAAMETRAQKYTYGTRGTPTTDALCEAIDALEGSAGTIVVPSGLAAVTVPFLALLSAGDHALIVDSVYGPTRHFCNAMLTHLGVTVDYYDPEIGAGIESLMRPNTRLVHTEAPGSNTFEMQDIRAIADVAHRHGAVVTMDNTWATPLYFRPLDHGVDISIHAATKYPAGHSDILLGTVSANAAQWERLHEASITLGICGSPDDSYQVLRGLRTMGVRLAHHGESALAIARWLETREEVAAVLHPALESFPGHALWKRDFKGASGVFSFVLKAEPGARKAKAYAFLDALRLFGLGWSWGGYESLAVHVNLNDRVIAKGPAEGTVIRLQIGLENVADLQRDLELGFAAASLL